MSGAKMGASEADRYQPLIDVLLEAVEQASRGKGRERHETDEKPFSEQVSCWIQREGFDYARGQAVKKLHESLRLQPEAATRELLGAINFCAIAIIDLRKRGG